MMIPEVLAPTVVMPRLRPFHFTQKNGPPFKSGGPDSCDPGKSAKAGDYLQAVAERPDLSPSGLPEGSIMLSL